MASAKDEDFRVAGTLQRTVAPPICEDKLTELERARQALRTQIDVYKSHIIETSRRLNNLVDINRLPPEILSKILFHTTLATRLSYHRCKKWIKIAHVCYLWREVALTTPTLWADITADELDWTREMLSRSKKAPLKITYPWNLPGFNRDHQEISTLVFQELQRVESLRIYNEDYTDYIRPPNMIPIAPLLSSLCINHDVQYHHEPKGQALSGILETIAMPKLAYLELTNTRLHWSTPLLQPTLTSLVFHRSRTPITVATPEQSSSLRSDLACVLKVLGDMPLLENLTLNNSLPPLHATALPQLDHYITLPILQRLNVTDAPDNCAFLLQHLIIPPSTAVTISCGVLLNDNLHNVTLAFASKLRESSTSSTLPPHHTLAYDTNSIRIWRDTIDLDTLRHQFHYGYVPLPQFKFNVHYVSDSVHVQPLSSILSSLPLDEVQSLILGPPVTSCDGGVHGWLEAFACMPNVHELAVQEWFENIPEALKTHLPLPTDQQSNQESKRKEACVPLPNLKVLRLADVRFRDYMNQRDEENSIFKRTKSMLQARKKSRRGVERLIIQRALNFDTEDKDDLHCLVEELEWDEREDLRAKANDSEEDEGSDLDPFGIWD